MKKGTNELNRTFSKEEVQMAKKHMRNAGHKGNANQNHFKIHFILLEWNTYNNKC
jgi:hypothetical protein